MLADFWIARNLDDVSGLTTTNMTVVTVAYSAPEQLMGQEIDGRADQYALAATAYHLLTGSQLFPHSNPGRHQPPPRLTTSGVGVHSPRACRARSGSVCSAGEDARAPIRALLRLRPCSRRTSAHAHRPSGGGTHSALHGITSLASDHASRRNAGHLSVVSTGEPVAQALAHRRSIGSHSTVSLPQSRADIRPLP